MIKSIIRKTEMPMFHITRKKKKKTARWLYNRYIRRNVKKIAPKIQKRGKRDFKAGKYQCEFR